MKLLLTLLVNCLLLLYTHYDYIVMGDGELKEFIYILCNLFTIGFDASIVTLIVYTVKNKHAKMAISGVFLFLIPFTIRQHCIIYPHKFSTDPFSGPKGIKKSSSVVVLEDF